MISFFISGDIQTHDLPSFLLPSPLDKCYIFKKILRLFNTLFNPLFIISKYPSCSRCWFKIQAILHTNNQFTNKNVKEWTLNLLLWQVQQHIKGLFSFEKSFISYFLIQNNYKKMYKSSKQESNNLILEKFLTFNWKNISSSPPYLLLLNVGQIFFLLLFCIQASYKYKIK